MALGKNLATGRFDADQNAVMKRVRKPRFVDNAVRHGEYTKSSSGFTVNKPTQSDFIPTPERKYKLIEEDDTIRIMHNQSDGLKYEGSIFYNNEKVSTTSKVPSLIVGADDAQQKLELSSVESSTKGSRYRIENLKGRSLKDIGFTDKEVRITQPIDIGLRTSDLAIKVVGSKKGAVNGIHLKSDSNKFLARDFYGINTGVVFKYLTKHDSFSIRNDKFGNLKYLPQQTHDNHHFIAPALITNGIDENDADDVYNRVIVRGKDRANNSKNAIQVDDFGSQDKGIKELPGGLSLPTAVTKSATRTGGRRILAMIKKAGLRQTLRDTLHSIKVSPGDSASFLYENREQKIVLHTHHDVNKKISQITVGSVDGTLEDVIEKFREVDVANQFDSGEERSRQFESIEFSTFAGFKIKSTFQISEKVDINFNQSMIIGSGVSSYMRTRRAMKSTGVLVNNGSGYNGTAPDRSDPSSGTAGVTSINVDGADPTSGSPDLIPVNSLVYKENGMLLGKVTGTTSSSLSFSGGLLHNVVDNEEIFLLSIDTFPEARYSNSKIGISQSNYITRRRA